LVKSMEEMGLGDDDNNKENCSKEKKRKTH
jgi:hypothetical protein